MTTPDPQTHWDDVYGRRRSDSVSWYEPNPSYSLDYIAAAGLSPASPIIDIGGGASLLVDRLLDQDYTDVTVLDVSVEALGIVRQRLGSRIAHVTLVRQDVTALRPSRPYALWHDRAVFHFLTQEAARRQYVDVLTQATVPGSHVVMATFGPDGPLRCSNLDTCRYDASSLAKALGGAFQLLRSSVVDHATPGGAQQQFLYALFRRT